MHLQPATELESSELVARLQNTKENFRVTADKPFTNHQTRKRIERIIAVAGFIEELVLGDYYGSMIPFKVLHEICVSNEIDIGEESLREYAGSIEYRTGVKYIS